MRELRARQVQAAPRHPAGTDRSARGGTSRRRFWSCTHGRTRRQWNGVARIRTVIDLSEPVLEWLEQQWAQALSESGIGSQRSGCSRWSPGPRERHQARRLDEVDHALDGEPLRLGRRPRRTPRKDHRSGEHCGGRGAEDGWTVQPSQESWCPHAAAALLPLPASSLSL